MSTLNLRVWLVDDDASIRWVLERALRNGGMLPRTFDAAEPALTALRGDAPDVLITDIRMSGQSGLELLKRIRETRPTLPVIVMTAYADLGNAVSAYESGAFEYLPKPFDIDQAVDLVRRAARTATPGTGDGGSPPPIPELLGRAAAMQQVFRAIGRLSRSSVTVLITGESGTGKELVARALHEHSPRAAKPFIALNTSAIPSELLESELFGHEKGAFTGADSLRRGRFEQADGGTLFLDEIGDMSTPLQTRLLRVLAEGEFLPRRRPDTDPRRRARHRRHPPEPAGPGTARRVPRGSLPSPERHPHRGCRHCARAPRTSRSCWITTSTSPPWSWAWTPRRSRRMPRKKLAAHTWPGNVRELVNLCRRLTVLAPGSRSASRICRPSWPPTASPPVKWTGPRRSPAGRTVRPWSASALLTDAQPEFERVLIRAALKRTQGHRQDAAKLLGWGRNTLTRKLKEPGNEPPPNSGRSVRKIRRLCRTWIRSEAGLLWNSVGDWAMALVVFLAVLIGLFAFRRVVRSRRSQMERVGQERAAGARLGFAAGREDLAPVSSGAWRCTARSSS